MSAERDAVKERSQERGRGVGGSKTETGKKCRRSTGEALEEHLGSVGGACGTGETLEERWRSVLGVKEEPWKRLRSVPGRMRGKCLGSVGGACCAECEGGVRETFEERKKTALRWTDFSLGAKAGILGHSMTE